MDLETYLKNTPRNPRGWSILDNSALLSFISVDTLWTKPFADFVSCLVVKNNWLCNSSTWKFYLVILLSLTLVSEKFAMFYYTVTLPWEKFYSCFFDFFFKLSTQTWICQCLELYHYQCYIFCSIFQQILLAELLWISIWFFFLTQNDN